MFIKRLRQRLCRHRWSVSIAETSFDPVIYLYVYCRKCGFETERSYMVKQIVYKLREATLLFMAQKYMSKAAAERLVEDPVVKSNLCKYYISLGDYKEGLAKIITPSTKIIKPGG